MFGSDFDFSEFEDFNQSTSQKCKTDNYRFCEYCHIPMECEQGELICAKCGLVNDEVFIEAEFEEENENKNGVIRVNCGKRVRTYNIGGDYSKVQKKNILAQLENNLTQYLAVGGFAVPHNILENVSEQYNKMQKLIDIDTGKKFVRRGDIKDEILAYLIWQECIRQNIGRKRKDIAALMKLSTRGFSRGNNIIHGLISRGYEIQSTITASAESFIERYKELINTKSPVKLNSEHCRFVCRIVEISEDQNIGMNSYISSKVVGAIWIVISHLNLQISSSYIEQCCDNTKKNTFMKFYNVVMKTMRYFDEVFLEYGIPLYNLQELLESI